MEKNIKKETEKIIGKVKEQAGKLTDNNELELKGKLQSMKANLGDKIDDVKDELYDKANDIIDKVRDRMD